ncbi:DNA primase [Corynebacterium sp. ES2794-CONJ1]|uniref:DNA primase n=1 Tax=unclassified Corynebacterium TaxID=2624378 RepID=UPI002167E334|nr:MULTISPECIES: DNA primase [unclassified Corynebacterium]MCS4490598.1 DNA primase [Corynebacterium sp. ES2775-CONJ]MCS4492377.1 DNA primase [Corynebacterium sp. ES2715-CONJ3]MCS4532431.1 DNA primase [Corynebacterium sp. ES2730-CONJ]MCU9519826.1 DNA primase [Corynebacterium sp. ES2794-CONJ1]
MGKGRIPESDIQAIREQAAIEEIVGEYVQLKPAGADSLKGLSPFKDEKTPSFHVRPQHGYFHCFSTGKGGDVFTFLMEMEHMSFPEAVEAVAEHIHYRINYQGGTTGAPAVEPGTRKRLIEANRAAHRFYREQLETPEAETARRFLLDRGFSKDLIYTFECGYAPEGWDTTTKHLLKSFSFKELEAAGISTMGKRGPVDRFRRRLIWPIKSTSSDVIGFGARKLFDDDTLGKYMNTPETILYKKSKVLFGLDKAKKSIAHKHQCVVVEGYTDVMAMHAAGVDTAVASCGTAFGPDHLQMIRRLMLDDSYFRGELIYTFDGDEAGKKAAVRAFDGDQKFTGQSYVSVAPDGMDPCDLRLEKGDAALRDLVAQRQPMFEFIIRNLISDYPLDSAEGRLQALRRTVPIVAGIHDRALRDEYARQLAGWVGWPNEREVLNQVRAAAKSPQQSQPPRRAQRFSPNTDQAPATQMLSHPDPKDSQLWPEREVLKLALQFPQTAGSFFDGLSEESFGHETYKVIARAIAKVGGCEHAAEDFIAQVAEKIPDLIGRSVLSELVVEEFHTDFDDPSDLDAYATKALSRLQEKRVGNQIAILKSQLQRMRPDEDGDSYRDLFADLVALEQARRELIERIFS